MLTMLSSSGHLPRAEVSLARAARASGFAPRDIERLARRGLIERFEVGGSWKLQVSEVVVLLTLAELATTVGGPPSERRSAALASSVRSALQSRAEHTLLLGPASVQKADLSSLVLPPVCVAVTPVTALARAADALGLSGTS